MAVKANAKQSFLIYYLTSAAGRYSFETLGFAPAGKIPAVAFSVKV
jgi:hypothetical protein